MNIPVLAAGSLTALLGLAHSVLGERLLLGPLFAKGELPRLLGSRAFARRTLRFAWHLTTVLMVGTGALIAVLALSPIEPQGRWILRFLAVIFGVCALVSLFGTRGKHFSWYVFVAIASLIWCGVA